jgi:hypothetical protein
MEKKRNFLLCLLLLFYNSLSYAENVPEQLILQMAKDDREVKQCVDMGGASKTTESLTVKEASLSNKGVELIVEADAASDDCLLCGNRRCSQWIYQNTAKGYKLLLKVDAADPIQSLSSSTHGLHDLKVIYPAGNFYPSTQEIYKFDGKRYRKYKSHWALVD